MEVGEEELDWVHQPTSGYDIFRYVYIYDVYDTYIYIITYTYRYITISNIYIYYN